ncbi:protein kinase [Streptomyces sp. NPDC049954]|uniref:protein kinase n=1 Tax=Streptomyces sp. NPDC049954 TaxID=3155779 RepID=UPI003420288D
MDDYAGRVLADRYRLPLSDPEHPDGYAEFSESAAFDTYSGQEVLVRQIPLPETVEAEFLDTDRPGGPAARRPAGRATRRPADPVVRRALEAAQAAAQVPDHPRLDQVFDVFVEGGSLWIVSERFHARSLATLLADRPLNPYRAAEVAADVLTALRALHAHGWVHRNITARTVLVCEDGRVVLTGLAAGAAEEALSGYDPVPERSAVEQGAGAEGPAPRGAITGSGTGVPGSPGNGYGGGYGYGDGPGGPVGGELPAWALASPPPPRYAAPGRSPDAAPGRPVAPAPHGAPPAVGPAASASAPALPPVGSEYDARAARAGAIAAYRAGARAAARAQAGQGAGAARTAPGPAQEERGAVEGAQDAQGAQDAGAPQAPAAPEPEVPGRISDPYGVQQDRQNRQDRQDDGAAGESSWHGAAPRRMPAQDPGTQAPGTGTESPAAFGQAPEALPVPAAWTGAPGVAPVPPQAVPPLPLPPHYERGPAVGPGLPPGAVPGPVPPQGHGPQGVAPGPMWNGAAAGQEPAPVHKGPATAVAAERARQARMVVVGAVTERWAPEQAGPVRGNWQLAAPVGPATDLWALGVLLFRAVQGFAPYPEDSTAELVQMVCSEPPAFAEECGPLRPVVESLLRQDPTERPDFEELRGWLRSLIRSAPEPEAGTYVVPAPAYDSGSLPIVRRKGELVRRRKRRAKAEAAANARHRRARGPAPGPERETREPRPPREAGQPGPPKEPRQRRTPSASRDRAPRSLGKVLLLAVFLLLSGTVVYAMAFMPKADDASRAGAEMSHAPGSVGGPGKDEPPAQPTGSAPAGSGSAPADSKAPEDKGRDKGDKGEKEQGGKSAKAPAGYTLQKDPTGFEIAVPKGWTRHARNAAGQVRYTSGDFELIVVPGRDSTGKFGTDLLRYQRETEPETQPFRDSTWSTSNGMREIDEGGRKMAEGQFTWQGGDGDVFARNMVMVVGGKYHVVQVRGLDADRDDVTRYYDQALASYKAG